MQQIDPVQVNAGENLILGEIQKLFHGLVHL